jgi:hypothetical protein
MIVSPSIYLYIPLDNSNKQHFLLVIAIVYMKLQQDKDIFDNHLVFHDGLDHNILADIVHNYHLLYDVDMHICPFPHHKKMNDYNNDMVHN